MLNTPIANDNDLTSQWLKTHYRLLGVYANGAARLRGRVYADHRIGFLDCPSCKGAGEIVIPHGRYGWSCFDSYEQCPACAERFGTRAVIVRKALELISAVRAEVNAARREGTDVKSAAFIDAYNTASPLAREYRRLLYRLWSYQEPEYIELPEGNAHETENERL